MGMTVGQVRVGKERSTFKVLAFRDAESASETRYTRYSDRGSYLEFLIADNDIDHDGKKATPARRERRRR